MRTHAGGNFQDCAVRFAGSRTLVFYKPFWPPWALEKIKHVVWTPNVCVCLAMRFHGLISGKWSVRAGQCGNANTKPWQKENRQTCSKATQEKRCHSQARPGRTVNCCGSWASEHNWIPRSLVWYSLVCIAILRMERPIWFLNVFTKFF